MDEQHKHKHKPTDMSVDGERDTATDMSIDQAIEEAIEELDAETESMMDETDDDDDDDDGEISSFELDCYPYSFTPLLLFAQASYFDKGHSNYNAVCQFFSTVVPVNMLENVLYERTNMLYEALYEHVLQNEMLVTCCIDAHFTGFKVVDKKTPSVIYYDPARATLQRVTGSAAVRDFIVFLLLKCNYGDSQHIQDNKDFYTGIVNGTNTRKSIYYIWKNINKTNSPEQLRSVATKATFLNLNTYLLINDRRLPRTMSTQLTPNTCYFQTYLFALLCKVGETRLDGTSIDLLNEEALADTTVRISRFLLEFFVSGRIMRPLTNCNFVLDFFRYEESPYFTLFTRYLKYRQLEIPDYDQQYRLVLQYYYQTRCLHHYGRFTLEGAMSSTLNTKSLQPVTGTEDAARKLARSNYYKYRAANLMFGFNAGIFRDLESFSEFNALRKNQLLRFYEPMKWAINGCAEALARSKAAKKYRDYFFMAQYEVGQQELVDIHHFTYILELCSVLDNVDSALVSRMTAANQVLVDHIYFSTQKQSNYEKMMNIEDFKRSKKIYRNFLNHFMTSDWFYEYIGLGFADINPKEKDINSLTQTVFYSSELMATQGGRMAYEFEKECINQMSRSHLRNYQRKVSPDINAKQKYRVSLRIGHGFTYSKYNTLFHFLNVVECYWKNPDLSNIQVFGKDIRVLVTISCQKIFFEKGHSGFYFYGPIECHSTHSRDLDLAMASNLGHVVPSAIMKKKKDSNNLVVTDRVFEFNYLKGVLDGIFTRAGGVLFKSDNEVLNLCLLSLMLDFGLYERHAALLNLPQLHCQHDADTQELQVEVANLIYERDRKNTQDAVTRSQVEELLFEASYKFIVNKDFPVNSKQFQLIRTLNADPDYQSYVLLVKIYMSLCQINRSVEVDYYKVHCDGEYRIIIPRNFSKSTSDYLEEVTKRYTFSVRDQYMVYDEYRIFDLRPHQPEINLHRVRFDSDTAVQSMVKYIEIANAFKVSDSEDLYLLFMADNILVLDVSGEKTQIWINKIAVNVATLFFNEAISFIPCFSYAESNDIILFASRNIHYMVDKGGQFATEYYGMRHEVIECINSDEVFVDLNDDHVFKRYKLSELLTESKTVLFYPDFLLQVPNRQELMNLLDLAARLRNVSFFILVLFYLRRCSVNLDFIEEEDNVKKISGPWKAAIMYVLGGAPNDHYDGIFQRQFFDLNQHKNMPVDRFIDVLCENFTKYQRYTEDGEYLIVPRPKQKAFLKRIICAEECFHFSEVGSGKSKVIVPLLCQAFLSENIEVHKHFARGGKPKRTLVILVPEHLVSDALAQVFRYCLNLNFRDEYRIYDDIFALLSRRVSLGGPFPMKQIFVTSFNQFKKALTVDSICAKLRPFREHILIVADEIDDFLDRDKLVFNICSNKSNAFDRRTLGLFFIISRAAYFGQGPPDSSFLTESSNPAYWQELFKKFCALYVEIQDASRSINKSFGIFNEETLKHCSTNIVHDIEGYKSLIARPYESVNRAMPGSYYSDVERTIFLTFVILQADVAKYNELFQAERKFISFEYWNEHFVHQLDFDDLVYGHEKLSEIVTKYPETKDGLTRFLYEIILRRMEIRDKSRSVNSIDIVFNFDCIGFTGTPFLDNYPTYEYIRHCRIDEIPDTIDRSFYAYTSDGLSQVDFEDRFARFQGQNSNVLVEYVPSDFIHDSTDEMATLESIFAREEWSGVLNTSDEAKQNRVSSASMSTFNAIVDLCGIFKRSTIHDVRNLIKKHYGPDRFHYVYHIDQTDSSDRVLSMNSDNDVRYDEEFYKRLCNTYGEGLRDRIFFFVDNRNVIGKDIPFQLVFLKHFGKPLFSKTVVIAHDVSDFSRIWQAMGRSRTMNDTAFSVYKSGIPDGSINEGAGAADIKSQHLTRLLYERNCDSKMSGNISSNFLLLIALFNLSMKSFYYEDNIVNTFIEKMENTIGDKVATLEEQLEDNVLGAPVPAKILYHILADKFRRSPDTVVSRERLTEETVRTLLRHIVQQKFEQRLPSGDKFDRFIAFLCGEQQSQMEISYTKQQQKQKQTQKNKNQDSDAMGIFDKKNQMLLQFETMDYFAQTSTAAEDNAKILMQLASSVPILKIIYRACGREHAIHVYPTLQFLYSHFIHGSYLTSEVQEVFISSKLNPEKHFENFVVAAKMIHKGFLKSVGSSASNGASSELDVKVVVNLIRQNPQYTLAALRQGIYMIGMKDQFNIHDMEHYAMKNEIQYVADEHGYILFDKTNEKSLESCGPYGLEQYILMEVLSKQEVAQNVIEYYCKHREILQRGLETYDEKQGKGFVCWRFLMNETVKLAAAAQAASDGGSKRNSPSPVGDDMADDDDAGAKKPRSNGAPGNGTDSEAYDDANEVAKSLDKSLDI